MCQALFSSLNSPTFSLLCNAKTVAFEIELDFETALVPDDAVFDDFVFVQGHGVNMFMVASSADNKLAIVDLVSGTPEPYYITFKDEPFVGRPRSRQVEHVAGTHYVWVSGPEDEEAYVIDIGSRKVVKTLNAVNVNILRSVVNWDFLSMARAIDSHWSDSGTWEDRLDSGVVESDDGNDTPSNNDNPTGINPSVGSSNAARVATKEDSDNKGMSIAAIVISLIALAAVMVNTIATMSQNKKPVKVTKSTPEKSLDNTDGDVESIDVPPSVN